MKRGSLPVVAGLLLVSALTACQAQNPTDGRPAAGSVSTNAGPARSESRSDAKGSAVVSPGTLPPVSVRASGPPVEITPYLYCFHGACNAAERPNVLPDIGRADVVVVSYPLAGWVFTAGFRAPVAGDLSREQFTTLRANADGTFTLDPIGRAGAYDVTLTGVGKGQGQFSSAFRWTTTVDVNGG